MPSSTPPARVWRLASEIVEAQSVRHRDDELLTWGRIPLPARHKFEAQLRRMDGDCLRAWLSGRTAAALRASATILAHRGIQETLADRRADLSDAETGEPPTPVRNPPAGAVRPDESAPRGGSAGRGPRPAPRAPRG